MAELFKTYEHAAAWVKKGRDPSVGRRSGSFMLKLEDTGVITVSHSYRVFVDVKARTLGWSCTPFAELRPGNVFTFTKDSADMRSMSASVSMCLCKVFGLAWERVSTGRYAVWHYEWSLGNYWDQRSKKQHYEHFNGMAWDISQGICFNPRPPMLQTVDKDARKVWVKALKKFRRAVHTRAKLGVVDSLIKQDRDYVRIDPEILAEEVLAAIKVDDVHTDLLSKLIKYAKRQNYSHHATTESVTRILESIIDTNSVKFRQEFGVLRK
jgi:hypothetical protein